MNQSELQSRLTTAKLFLGLIENTLPEFVAANPSPIGFMAIDVDLYTSTVDSLRVLDADHRMLLPRIHCYFDDILGFSFAEFNGERLAVAEFNQSHAMRKISPIYGLRYFVPATMQDSPWVECMYMAHLLDHNLYNEPDGLVTLKQEHLRSQRKGQ